MVIKIKRQNAQKKCVIKKIIKLKDYKTCLKATQLENKTKQVEKIRLIPKVLEKTIMNS